MQNLSLESKKFIKKFAEANSGMWNGKNIEMTEEEAFEMISQNSANGIKTTIENGYFKRY